MTIKVSNILKLTGVALAGGLCSFAIGSVFSLMIPLSASAGMIVSIGLSIVAVLCMIASLFLKKPYKFSLFTFFLGFVLISKLFEGLFVYFYNIF